MHISLPAGNEQLVEIDELLPDDYSNGVEVVTQTPAS